MAKMNNDLKEQDMLYCGDPMFAEILRDLTSFPNQNSNDELNNTEPSKESNENKKEIKIIDQIKESPQNGVFSPSSISFANRVSMS